MSVAKKKVLKSNYKSFEYKKNFLNTLGWYYEKLLRRIIPTIICKHHTHISNRHFRAKSSFTQAGSLPAVAE